MPRWKNKVKGIFLCREYGSTWGFCVWVKIGKELDRRDGVEARAPTKPPALLRSAERGAISETVRLRDLWFRASTRHEGEARRFLEGKKFKSKRGSSSLRSSGWREERVARGDGARRSRIIRSGSLVGPKADPLSGWQWFFGGAARFWFRASVRSGAIDLKGVSLFLRFRHYGGI